MESVTSDPIAVEVDDSRTISSNYVVESTVRRKENPDRPATCFAKTNLQERIEIGCKDRTLGKRLNACNQPSGCVHCGRQPPTVNLLVHLFWRDGLTVPCLLHLDRPAGAAFGVSLAQPVAAMGSWLLFPVAGAAHDPALAVEERAITPVDAAELEFITTSLATQPAFPPALIEYDAGWFAPHDDSRPEPSPAPNTRLSSYLLLTFGLRGLNWFPFQDSLKKADEVLRKWDTYAPRFVKVFPRDYKRALTDRIAAGSGNG